MKHLTQSTQSDDNTGKERGRRGFLTDDERGLSELIGFVLAFAVIIIAVALVSTSGLDALATIQDSQQENNAEQAFSVMAENFDEIERGVAPSRTAEIDLHDGNLRVQNVTNVRIQVDHAGTSDFTATVSPRRVVLQPDPSSQTIIAYESGAVIRGENRTGQGVFDNRPEMTCDDGSAIVSIVSLNTSENRQLGGGTVRVTGRNQETRLVYPRNRAGQNSSRNVSDFFNVSIRGGFETAWRQTLVRSDQQDWERAPHNENRVVCPDPDRVYVRETVINVTFVR